MTEMNADIKTKWVEALRSGKYKQTTSVLNSGDTGFCCLGVLCEIAVEEGVIERIYAEHGPGEKTRFQYKGESDAYWEKTSPPKSVVEWAGLSSEDPVADGDTLMGLNDVQRKSFDYIADVIEREF